MTETVAEADRSMRSPTRIASFSAAQPIVAASASFGSVLLRVTARSAARSIRVSQRSDASVLANGCPAVSS